MKYSCSGIILAGGLSSRFSGKCKAFLTVGNQRIIDRLFYLFQDLFQEVILVTNEPLKYLEWDCHIVSDLYDLRSSLTGIHAGLFHSSMPYAFFSACDTPFLKKELVETIVESIESGLDVVIPETAEGVEPLCAVYSARCIQFVTLNLERKRLKVQNFFKKVRVRKLPESKLRKVDPQLLSFFNVNTPEDLARAEKLMAVEG